jgi:hypothetical protein
MPKKIFSILLITGLFFSSAASISQELSAKEIIRKSDQLIHGRLSNQGELEMIIATPYFERKLKLKAWNKGMRKTFVRINAPAKEAGIGSLKIGNEMWTYLPAIEKVIKVPPSMMMASWMGSDFTNDDMVRESSLAEDYNHKIVAEEKIDDYSAYKIEALPKPNAPVVWGKRYYWARQRDYVPLREEFYDEKGNLIKEMEYKEIKLMGGRVIPTFMTMRTLGKEGSKTILRIIQCQYDIAIPESIFSLRNLQTVK